MLGAHVTEFLILIHLIKVNNNFLTEKGFLKLNNNEYKIIASGTKLTIDKETRVVIDTTHDIKLKCKGEKEQCTSNLNQYIWSLPKSKCNLFHVKFVTGYELETNKEKYFVANQSMIYLKMMNHEIKCNKKVIKNHLSY